MSAKLDARRKQRLKLKLQRASRGCVDVRAALAASYDRTPVEALFERVFAFERERILAYLAPSRDDMMACRWDFAEEEFCLDYGTLWNTSQRVRSNMPDISPLSLYTSICVTNHMVSETQVLDVQDLTGVHHPSLPCEGPRGMCPICDVLGLN